MVPVSCDNLGSMFTVLVTSAGTLTTLPVILSCLPLGAWKIFWNAKRGAISLHSNSFRSKKFGFSGNFMPFAIAHGGILPFLKWLLQVLQSHSTLLTLLKFCRYLAISGFTNLIRSAGQTLCLYHNCSQQLHTYSGPVDIES